MMPLGTPVAPRLLTDETCAPAKLTNGSGDLQARSAFRFFHGAFDGLRGGGKVHNDSLADARRRLNAHAEDAEVLIILHAPNEGANLGRAYVNAYNYLIHVIVHHSQIGSSSVDSSKFQPSGSRDHRDILHADEFGVMRR
jgi:hypothetical protein